MLIDFREFLKTLSDAEVAILCVLLAAFLAVCGFLSRRYFFKSDLNAVVDEAVKKALEPQNRSAAEQSPRSIDPQTVERAAEDLKELVADKTIENNEEILAAALKAANKDDPDQSLRILEPLRAEYQSAKDTADRELARLAFVTATLIFANDPVRARPYLEEAATLAPDNFIYLITYGRDLEVTGQSEKAKEIFAEALKVATSENNQRNIALANDEIGRIQQVQGDLEAALKSYQDALRIAEELVREAPDNRGWQHDLSVCYIKIGDIKRAQGGLEAALNSYQDGLEIRKELVREAPSNRGWQRDLSISYERIGDIQQAQGDLAEALKSYQDGLAIRKDLARKDPGNKEWQRDLSISYEKIGDIQQAQGDLAGALKSYQDGLAIRKDLAKEDPTNKEWQRDLSVSFNKIGDIQEVQGDLAAALNSYQEGLTIRKELASQDSSNMQWQADLAYSYVKISFVDKEFAKEHLLKAKDILAGPYEKGLLTAQQITAYETVLEMLDQHK